MSVSNHHKPEGKRLTPRHTLRTISTYVPRQAANIFICLQPFKFPALEKAKKFTILLPFFFFFLPLSHQKRGFNQGADEANTRTEIVTSGVSGGQAVRSHAELPFSLKEHRPPSNTDICPFLHFAKPSWLRATPSKRGLDSYRSRHHAQHNFNRLS